MSVYKELAKIQQALKAPKGQYNNFGKYKYRNCEDILEAVKPLLGDLLLVITDSIEMIGDRHYVKATATIYHDDGAKASSSAYAREPLSKKGMDESQITGSSSSYARKYALNGLFAIDDSKDADNFDYSASSLSNKAIKNPIVQGLADDPRGVCVYWRGLNQDSQQKEWKTLDKETQKLLKETLKQYPM